MYKKLPKSGGVTIIEMLTVIIIASILLTAAIASYRSIIQNNRTTGYTNDFVRAVHFTRNEAIKHSSTVAICAAASPTATSCGTSSDWSKGWLIFEDNGANGLYDTGIDTLLSRHDNLSGQAAISASSASLVYSGAGFLRAGSGMFTFTAPGCSGKSARNVDVSNNGRISIQATNCP